MGLKIRCDEESYHLVYHEVLQAAVCPPGNAPLIITQDSALGGAGPVRRGNVATTNQNVREMRETRVARQHSAPAEQAAKTNQREGSCRRQQPIRNTMDACARTSPHNNCIACRIHHLRHGM